MGVRAVAKGTIEIRKADRVSLQKIIDDPAYYELSICVKTTTHKRETYIHKVVITFWNTYGEQATARLTAFLKETKAVSYDIELESRFIK